MITAEFNGTIVAESDATVIVEGNHYFPPSSVKQDVLRAVDHATHCPWKGDAGYYDIVVDGATAANGAWYYAEPKDAAAEICDHIAFYAPPVIVND